MDRRQFLMWSALFAPFVRRWRKNPAEQKKIVLFPHQSRLLDELHGTKTITADTYVKLGTYEINGIRYWLTQTE